MDYKVVWTSDKDLSKAVKDLTSMVKELYSYGWKLQEGISIALDKYNYYYVCQTMVK